MDNPRAHEVAETAEECRLGRPRLVARSACETGLYDAHNNPEEFVGLPATFLQLGAATCVATPVRLYDAYCVAIVTTRSSVISRMA